MAIIPEDKDGSVPAISAALTRDPVCAVLRGAREQAGYDIVDISQLLRIQRPYLEAIEEGRYGDLPGTVYAIGFVRTYSDFLNLDTNDMVRRFKEEASELSRRTDYVFPVPPTEARVPGVGILVVGVLLAALAYGVWYVSSGGETRLVDRVSEIPDRFAELAARGGGEAQTDEIAALPEAEGDTSLASDAPDGAATAVSANVPPDLDRLAAGAAPEPAATDVPAAAEPEAPAQSSPAETSPVPAPPVEIVEETPPAPPAEPVAPAAVAAAPAEPAPPMQAPAEPVEPARRAIEPIETVQTVDTIRRVPPPGGGESAPGQFEVAAAPTGLPKAATGPSADPQGTSAPTNILPTGQPTVATAPPPPPPAVQSDQPRRNGLGNLNSRILIRATEMSWVQITDDLGNLVMTRVLDPGESYRVPNTEGLTLASGNAGGLEVIVDGVVQAPLGLRGTVVRNVTLDPDNFGAQ